MPLIELRDPSPSDVLVLYRRYTHLWEGWNCGEMENKINFFRVDIYLLYMLL